MLEPLPKGYSGPVWPFYYPTWRFGVIHLTVWVFTVCPITMLINNFSIVLLFLQGGLTLSIISFTVFSAMFYGVLFRSCCAPFTIAPSGLLGRVVLGALLLPWGSLARWLLFLIYTFPQRITRPLHWRSPFKLSDCDGRYSIPWTAWIHFVIMRCLFLEGLCSLFPAGLIRWDGDCVLGLIVGEFSRR